MEAAKNTQTKAGGNDTSLKTVNGQSFPIRDKTTAKSFVDGHGTSELLNITSVPTFPAQSTTAQGISRINQDANGPFKTRNNVADDKFPGLQRRLSENDERFCALPTSLYESGRFADVIIRCGREDFKVHEAIVAPASSFFATVFEYCTEEENGLKIVTLEEIDDRSIDDLMRYIYDKTYRTTAEHPFYHLHMFLTAVNYRVPALESFAKSCYMECISHKNIDLRDVVYSIYKTNAQWAMSLRRGLLIRLIEKLPVLLKDERFQYQLRTFKGLAYDLLMLQGDPDFDGPWQVESSKESELAESETSSDNSAPSLDGDAS